MATVTRLRHVGITRRSTPTPGSTALPVSSSASTLPSSTAALPGAGERPNVMPPHVRVMRSFLLLALPAVLALLAATPAKAQSVWVPLYRTDRGTAHVDSTSIRDSPYGYRTALVAIVYNEVQESTSMTFPSGPYGGRTSVFTPSYDVSISRYDFRCEERQYRTSTSVLFLGGVAVKGDERRLIHYPNERALSWLSTYSRDAPGDLIQYVCGL